jgi:hypothetical protein
VPGWLTPTTAILAAIWNRPAGIGLNGWPKGHNAYAQEAPRSAGRATSRLRQIGLAWLVMGRHCGRHGDVDRSPVS